jgi:hypothetical protein
VAYYATQTKGLKDADIMNLHFPIVRKLFNAGFPKDEIEFLMSFIQKYVKFGNQKNHRIFEQKIEGMAKFDYDTTEDLLAVLDTSLQLKRLEQKANLLEQEKERERGEKERERGEKERERGEKERERQLKERSVLLLLQKGTDMELIAEVLRVPVKEILDIQEKYKDWDLFDDAPNSTN